MLHEMFQRNASKFEIFLEYENHCIFFLSYTTLFFLPIECPGLVYVNIDQSLENSLGGKK